MSVDLDAAVEAGARAAYEDWRELSPTLGMPAWDVFSGDVKHALQEGVLVVIDAAAPLIEAQVRESIAREIEVKMREHDHARIGFSALGDAYADAARIARGVTK